MWRSGHLGYSNQTHIVRHIFVLLSHQHRWSTFASELAYSNEWSRYLAYTARARHTCTTSTINCIILRTCTIYVHCTTKLKILSRNNRKFLNSFLTSQSRWTVDRGRSELSCFLAIICIRPQYVLPYVFRDSKFSWLMAPFWTELVLFTISEVEIWGCIIIICRGDLHYPNKIDISSLCRNWTIISRQAWMLFAWLHHQNLIFNRIWIEYHFWNSLFIEKSSRY